MSKFSAAVDRISIFIASCCFSGFVSRAPGTIGSLLGALAYPVTLRGLDPLQFFPAYGVLLCCTIWICGRAAEAMGEVDPPPVILDEFIAMPLCYWPLEQFHMEQPPLWIFLLVGFALFRFFDILKPLAINRIQSLRGGFGIVLDDTAAAIATALSMAIAAMIYGVFF